MNVVIIGASPKKERYSNKAMRAYLKKGHNVFLVNPKYEEIDGIKVYNSIKEIPIKDIDIVSVYVNPKIGINLVDDIVKIKPKEVILNPGSESNELINKLKENNINVVLACTIQSIGEDPKNY